MIPVRETQGLDASSLLHLRREVQVFHDAVAAHESTREQQYVFSYIGEFLASIPEGSPVQDINAILECFDNLTLAFYTMSQVPNERERLDWIHGYKCEPVSRKRFDDLYHQYLGEGISSLMAIRASLPANRTNARYCFYS